VRRRRGGFPNRRSMRLRSAGRKVRRGSHGNRCLGFVLTTRPSPVRWETSLDPRVKPRVRCRKASQTCSGCSELGADAFVPEGDASEARLSRKGYRTSMPRHQSQVSFGKGSSSQTRRGGSAGEQERMPASKLVGRSRWRLITPSLSPVLTTRMGGPKPDGDIPTER
jgi:hypothetical protein